MKYDSTKIAESIRKAVATAQTWIEYDDGGTCNFDSAYLQVPRMSEKQAAEIEGLCGVSLSLHTYAWHGRILQVIGGMSGQGMRRTKMAEAIRDSLCSDGLNVGMWYQMD